MLEENDSLDFEFLFYLPHLIIDINNHTISQINDWSAILISLLRITLVCKVVERLDWTRSYVDSSIVIVVLLRELVIYWERLEVRRLLILRQLGYVHLIATAVICNWYTCVLAMLSWRNLRVDSWIGTTLKVLSVKPILCECSWNLIVTYIRRGQLCLISRVDYTCYAILRLVQRLRIGFLLHHLDVLSLDSTTKGPSTWVDNPPSFAVRTLGSHLLARVLLLIYDDRFLPTI